MATSRNKKFFIFASIIIAIVMVLILLFSTGYLTMQFFHGYAGYIHILVRGMAISMKLQVRF